MSGTPTVPQAGTLIAGLDPGRSKCGLVLADAETLRERDPRKLIPPLHGALLKNEQDVKLFERLAFMTRREQR